MLPRHPFDLGEVVARDHQRAEALFGRIERAEGRRQALFDQVIRHVALYGAATEAVVGPALLAVGDEASAEEATAAMQPVTDALVELDHHEAGTDEAERAMRIVVDALRLRVPLVERDQLPRLRDVLGDERLVELGHDYLGHARRAPTRPHRHTPATAVGVASTALLDKLRDRMSGRDLEHLTDASGRLDPDAQLLVDELASLGPRPVHLLDPGAARRQPGLTDAVTAFLRRERSATGPEEVAAVEDLTLAGPGGEVALRVYRPATAASSHLPVLAYAPGGGWVLGGLDAGDATCRSLANRCGALVVSIGYRRAPEHPFPAPLDDVQAALVWIREHAADLGGDPQRLAAGGEGMGATAVLAASLAFAARGAALPLALLLVHPMTSTSTDWESYAETADAVPVSTAAVAWSLGHLVRTPADLLDQRLDLLSVPHDQLAALPPTFVVTAGRDPLRDQAEVFANRLDGAGVRVEAVRYPGMPHGFFGGGAVLDAAVDAQRRAARALRAAFAAAVVVDVTP